MRSLFFKIFAWFWLANILVVGILALAIGPPNEPKRDQFRAMTGDLLEMYGQRGLAVLQTNGTAAYAAFRAELESRTGMRLFILDANGNDLQGAALPEGADEVVQRARASRDRELEFDSRHSLFLACLASPSAAPEHVLLARLPGPPSRFFASPYQTLLRVLAAVIVAGLLCYGLAHYLTAPLRNLRRSARELAGGQLQARVGPGVENRGDEIGDLGQDFNFMAERIESLVSSQQRLILDMSHELRSPLARLNLALGLAVQRAGGEAQSALERIGRETDRLNNLIERLLVLARLEQRETSGARIAVDLSAMLCDIAADAQFEARAQGRDARLVRCDYCTAAGVPHLLRSAVDNVVRNALRHTQEGTTVEISLTMEPAPASRAIIRVRDHGPGVPPESLERIFQPFCRVSEDRNRHTGGVGLGLAIASQATKLHDGTIAARNAPDGGLIVEIQIPATPRKPSATNKPEAAPLADGEV